MSRKRDLNLPIILNAAIELAEEKGLENVSLLQVAEKLGVKSPSLYNHLSGLQELSMGMAKTAVKRLEDTVKSAAIGRSKEDALVAIAVSHRKFAKENPELYKSILRFPDYHDEGIQETGHAVVCILYQVMEPYHLTREETIHFVRGFRSLLHGFVSLEEAGFFQGTEANIEASYEKMVLRWVLTLDTGKSD